MRWREIAASASPARPECVAGEGAPREVRWQEGSFRFDHPDGHVGAQDPSAHHGGPSALLYDEASLRELLDGKGISLVWTVLGEKNVSGDHRPEGILVMSGVATLESGTAEIEVGMRTRLEP